MERDASEFLRAWFEEIWNQRNEQRIRDWTTPDFVAHSEGGDIHGAEDFINYFHRPFLASFPDLHLAVERVIGSGADAAIRWTFTGTHQHEFLGIPPSERKLRVTGMSWIRCEGDKVAEGWDSWNMSGMITALRDGTTTANVKLT